MVLYIQFHQLIACFNWMRCSHLTFIPPSSPCSPSIILCGVCCVYYVPKFMSCFPFVIFIFIGKRGDSALDEVGAPSSSLFQAQFEVSRKAHLHSHLWFCSLFLLSCFQMWKCVALQTWASGEHFHSLFVILFVSMFVSCLCVHGLVFLCTPLHVVWAFKILLPFFFSLICKGGSVVIEAKKPLPKLFQAWDLGENFRPLSLFIYVCTI
jgi:hypothetical protein